MVEIGVFRYAETCDQLFGVVAALLGELATRPRGAC
jgi:hypothetical protein